MTAAVRRIACNLLQFSGRTRDVTWACLGAQGTRGCSSTANIYNGRDPAPVFFSSQVQSLLQRVTSIDVEKVFRHRLDERTLEVPRYAFLTDQQLKEHYEEAERKAQVVLQMPPVVLVRESCHRVLSSDPAINGLLDSKFVFTDITFGVSDRARTVVVRETDGTLRHATWEERDRMNQVYNPRPGRFLHTPKLFSEENLKAVVDRGEYQFVLDAACAQFEPDHPLYQHVVAVVYEAVDSHRAHHTLRSTRHYGPLCFYLAWHRSIDTLLASLVQDEEVSNAADIVRLYQAIHADCKTPTLPSDTDQHLDLVKLYLEHDCLQRAKLQLSVQAYEELLE